jgi:hypothetical protein
VTRTFYLYGCEACGQRWWTVNDGATLSDDERVGHDCPEDYPAGGLLTARFVDDPADWTPLRSVA